MSQDDFRKNHTCITCQQPIDSRDLASMQCGHPFHYQCLQISLIEQIQKQTYPLCCPIPQCFVEPSMYFLSVVLEEKDFSDYLVLEKNSVQAFQTYSCRFCDQTFLAFPSNKIHKCLKCYKVLCLQCGDVAHPNKPCSNQNNSAKQPIQLSKKDSTDSSKQIEPITNISAQPEHSKNIQIRSFSLTKKTTIEIPPSPSSNSHAADCSTGTPKIGMQNRKLFPATSSISPNAASALGSKKNSFMGSSSSLLPSNASSSIMQAQPEKNIFANRSRGSLPVTSTKTSSISLMKQNGNRKSFDRINNYIQQGEDQAILKNLGHCSVLKIQQSPLLQQKISC